MKWLLVTIFRGTQIDEPVMLRLPPWDSDEISRNSASVSARDHGLAQGDDTEEELWYLTDVVADKYSGAEPAAYRILTDEEADAWCEAAAARRGDPDVIVSDPARVQAVATKLAAADLAERGALPAGVSAPKITQEDMDALDPEKSTPGINRVPKTAREIFGVGSSPGRRASEELGPGVATPVP